MSRNQFFYYCMLAPNDRELFKAVFSNLLASNEFITEIEGRKESGLVSILQTFCEILAMQ